MIVATSIKPKRSRGPHHAIEIDLDGRPFRGKQGHVFIEALKAMHLDRVAGSGVLYAGWPLVGTAVPPRPEHYKRQDGYYINMTNNAHTKCALAEQVGRALKRSVKARVLTLKEEILS